MAALLTLDMGNQDKTIKNIAECREMGIDILPPDVNESQADFSVVEGKIRFGLAAVKNVGLKAVETLIEERSNRGPFRDLVDFCRRMESSKVNRRVLEGLIECGAFDFTHQHRSQLLAALDEVLRFCGANHDPNKLSIFGAAETDPGQPQGLFDYPDVEEWDEKEKLRREKESLGFYITGHPLAGFHEEIRRFATCSVQDLHLRKDKSVVTIAGVVENLKIKRTKRGDRMAVLSMEDLTGSTDVIVFPDVFQAASHLLRGEEALLLTGTVETGESSSKIIAKEIVSLDTTRQRNVKAIEIRLREMTLTKSMLEDLQDIAFRYPGECKIRFTVGMASGEEITISAHERFSVLPCPELFREMEAVMENGGAETLGVVQTIL
jgi:DNA polymerase-3 subunit alpha